MCECCPGHLIRDVVHLGGIGFEEFQACGDIVKEVVNRHVRAGRAAALLYGTEDSTLNANFRPFKCVGGAGEEFKLRDRGDTG